MAHYLEILFIVLFSSVKFALVPPIAILQYNYSILESIIYTTIGGTLGVFTFYFLSKELLLLWHIVKAFILRKHKHHYHLQHKQRPRFTTFSRRLVRFKQRWGLVGLVVITPCVLSIPVGTFIAAKYYPGKHSIFLLCCSVFIWSLVLNGSVLLFEKAF
ncbi:MAG: hypothetical protein WCP85_30020 [Mariniphaga sp.]